MFFANLFDVFVEVTAGLDLNYALNSKQLTTGQVCFSNGQFLLDPTILIPDHFGPSSCFSYLKSRQKSSVFE
jgi:hypothetical protein